MASVKIGLLSDTHGWLDDQVLRYFEDCNEVWHAGDIGDLATVQRLTNFKKLRAVYGNIDGQDIRTSYPKDQHFVCAGMQVWMTHIGGNPPRYTPEVLRGLQRNLPDIFVCGHSHILRIMRDPKHPSLLYLNPGAAGRAGFHRVRTLLRFTLQNRKISHMRVIELDKV